MRWASSSARSPGVIFRRRADERAVLVVTSGDRRVDERKVAAHAGPIGRADAAFVKARTGFSIGGVAPVAHLEPPVVLIDRELFRFDRVWAACRPSNTSLPAESSRSGPAGQPGPGARRGGQAAPAPATRPSVQSCVNLCPHGPGHRLV